MRSHFSILRVVLASLVVGAFGSPATAQPTPLTEVVMYTVDADTAELLRFVFEVNEFEIIGEMRNQNGELMEDLESLAFIPNGLSKGFYGVAVSGGPSSSKYKLSRIDPLTANVTVYDIGPSSGPLNYTRALTARNFAPDELFPGESGGWRLLAIRTRSNNTECYMIVVDPADGQIIPIPGQTVYGMPVKQSGSYVQVEGLAIDEDGEYFGTSYHDTTKKSRLWHLDVDWATAAVEAIPLSGYSMPDRMEALEFAFGDNEIDATGLPGNAATWPHSAGVLIGFSDDEDSLVVMDADLASPTLGDWEYMDTLYGEPIAFMSVDTEGIIFTTRNQDPNEPLRNPFD